MWMWRTSIVNASDRIFPGLAYYDRKKEFYDVGTHFAFIVNNGNGCHGKR